MKSIAKRVKGKTIMAIFLVVLTTAAFGGCLGLIIFMLKINDGSIESGGWIMYVFTIIFFLLSVFSFNLLIQDLKNHDAIFVSEDKLYFAKNVVLKVKATDTNAAKKGTGKSMKSVYLSEIKKVQANIVENRTSTSEVFVWSFLFGIFGYAIISIFKNTIIVRNNTLTITTDKEEIILFRIADILPVAYFIDEMSKKHVMDHSKQSVGEDL